MSCLTASRNQIQNRPTGCGGICHRVQGPVERRLSERLADSGALMRQRRTIFRRVAGVQPNNLLQSDPESDNRLWRNLPSSSVISMLSIMTTLKRVSYFLSFDATVTRFILLDIWHRAQEHHGVGFSIDCLAVVEGCSCGLGVWILSVVMKRGCRVTSSLRLSAENPPARILHLRVL